MRAVEPLDETNPCLASGMRIRLPEFTQESVSAKKLTIPPSDTGTLKKLTP